MILFILVSYLFPSHFRIDVLRSIGAGLDNGTVVRQAVVDVAKHRDAEGHQDDVRPLFSGECCRHNDAAQPENDNQVTAHANGALEPHHHRAVIIRPPAGIVVALWQPSRHDTHAYQSLIENIGNV